MSLISCAALFVCNLRLGKICWGSVARIVQIDCCVSIRAPVLDVQLPRETGRFVTPYSKVSSSGASRIPPLSWLVVKEGGGVRVLCLPENKPAGESYRLYLRNVLCWSAPSGSVGRWAPTLGSMGTTRHIRCDDCSQSFQVPNVSFFATYIYIWDFP